MACASDTLASVPRLTRREGAEVVGFGNPPVALLPQPPMSSARQPLQHAAEGVLLPPQLTTVTASSQQGKRRPKQMDRESIG
jgi:hypothetical protein